MKKFHNDWRKYLVEGSYNESVLLREISEDEVELIQDAIDSLEPEDLPFNELFGGKERIVIPFPTFDTKTETGRFISFLTMTDQGTPIGLDSLIFGADFQTGMMTKARPPTTDDLVGLVMGREVKERPREKMKIGKWLAAVEKLVTNFIANRKSLLKAATNQDLTEDEHATLERLSKTMVKLLHTSQISFFLKRLGVRDKVVTTAQAVDGLEDARQTLQQMRAFWQKNAKYLKDNPQGELTEDNFSIVITRNPVDILRMSDFDNITSCHSPPSRSGEGLGSYFKCAVAEAQGEGAIAYVVKNSDLEDINIDDYEGRELFLDKRRGVGEITPISRIRLRLVRKHDDENIRTAKEINDIAVPETRVYGEQIPGLDTVILNWAAKNQQKVLNKLPILDRGGGKGALNMKHFTKFGGTYEDTDTQVMLLKLAGLYTPPFNIAALGRMNVNTEVEDSVGLETSETRAQFLLDQCETLVRTYRTRNFYVLLDSDYDDEGAWVIPNVQVVFRWPTDEWKALPRREQILEFIEEVEMNYGSEYGWLSHYGATAQEISTPDDKGRPDKKVVLRFPVHVSKIHEDGMSQFYDEGEFENFLEDLNALTGTGGTYEAMKYFLEQYMKTEGLIDGGAVIRLGREVEFGDKDLYEWSWHAEEGYDDPFELVSATTRQVVDYSDIPGATKDAVELILNTRDFWLDIRKRMHAAIHDDFKNKYFVDIERNVRDIDENDFEYDLTYFVGDDTPDEVVEIFEALVEHWDDQLNLEDLFRTVVSEFLKKVKSLQRLDDPATNINEHKVKPVSDQKLFNNWRNFLQGG